MRLVTIDNGNSNPHVALFHGKDLQEVVPLALYQHNPEDYVLICSVGKPLEIRPSFDLRTKRTKTHFFDMEVHYAETLGDDRLMAGFYVYKNLAPKEKVLLIDAGTFLTCDLITHEGFMGGYIFPGINRFLRSYTQSAQLPLITKDKLEKLAEDAPLPRTTEEAILHATTLFLTTTINEIIKKNAPDKIVFTGGNANDVSNLLSLTVRSETVHHLIHLAMAQIFQTHLARE